MNKEVNQNHHVFITAKSSGCAFPEISLTIIINRGANINCSVCNAEQVFAVANLMLIKKNILAPKINTATNIIERPNFQLV